MGPVAIEARALAEGRMLTLPLEKSSMASNAELLGGGHQQPLCIGCVGQVAGEAGPFLDRLVGHSLPQNRSMAIATELRYWLDERCRRPGGRLVAGSTASRNERCMQVIAEHSLGVGSMWIVATSTTGWRQGKVSMGCLQSRGLMAITASARGPLSKQVPHRGGMRLMAGKACACRCVGMSKGQAGLDLPVTGQAEILDRRFEERPSARVMVAMADRAFPFALKAVRGPFQGRGFITFVTDHAQSTATTRVKEVQVGLAMGLVAPLALPLQHRLVRGRGCGFLDYLWMAGLAVGLVPGKPPQRHTERKGDHGAEYGLDWIRHGGDEPGSEAGNWGGKYLSS